MNGHALKELAKAIATVAHDGQSRKGAGEPYINHPARMSESPRIWGWRQQALCWLHDVVEDSADPEQMLATIRLLFGDEFARDLLWLTRAEKHGWLVNAHLNLNMPSGLLSGEHGEKLVYRKWIEIMAEEAPLDVIGVKLADLEDNLHDIRDVPGASSQEAKYLHAKASLLDALEARAS